MSFVQNARTRQLWRDLNSASTSFYLTNSCRANLPVWYSSKGYQHVLCFELGRMFAPNGEIFDEATARGLMDIPEMKGMKHSSLDRLIELDRLSMRDAHRPEFRIYTGNDLGINMIEYGSDYLLGLATLVPEKFAERDSLWQSGDVAYYVLSDALQHLGNVVFREPVPAYKHSAAIFLHRSGRIPEALTHPKNPKRPEWEGAVLQDCARRLGIPWPASGRWFKSSRPD